MLINFTIEFHIQSVNLSLRWIAIFDIYICNIDNDDKSRNVFNVSYLLKFFICLAVLLNVFF